MTSLDVVLLTILFGHLSTLSVKIYWLQGSTYNTGLPGHFQIRWGQAYMVGCNLNPTLLVYDWSKWQNKLGTNLHCPLMFRRSCNGIWSEQTTVDYHNTTPQKFNNPIYNFLFSVQRLGHQNLHLWIHNLHHFLVTGHYNLLLLSVCSFLYCALLT